VDSEHGSQSHWIPLADLMTGLMMIFMLLMAAFMLRVEQTTTLVVQEFEETKKEMELALQKEFSQDLKKWNADMLGDMTIRFNDPAVLFATGSAELRPQFKEVLQDFFPRYIKLLTSERFISTVREIRIEGHTSKFWSVGTSEQFAYIRNMELSQARTRSALEYLLTIPAVAKSNSWFIGHVTANGLSSSRPVSTGKGSTAHSSADQRVEFRIVTNANERMEQIARDLAQQ